MSLVGVLELARLVPVFLEVERARTSEGPQGLVERLRARGQRSVARDEAGRARLRRLIGALDRRLAGGPNCYRRVLVEIAVDAGAAREPVYLALRAGGGPGTGHACLASENEPLAGYDAVFVM